MSSENQIKVNLDLVNRFSPLSAIVAGIIVRDNEWVTLDKLTSITGLSRQAIAREINIHLYDETNSGIFTKRKWFSEKEGKTVVIYGLTADAFNELIGG